MKDVTVLITGAGAPGAPGIIKSLRLVNERALRVVGVDMNESSVGFSMVDNWHLVPSATEDDFIPEILNICQKETVDVVIPLVTKELMPFAQNRGLFEEQGIKVSISEPPALRVANNKHLLMECCQSGGVPTPQFIKVEDYEAFEQAVLALGYPDENVCFKPPVSNGLRGFRILTREIDRLELLINEKPMNVVATLEDVAPILREAERFPELLVMEYLPGKEYSVDVLADRGKPIVVIPRLREKIKMGISFVGITTRNEKVIESSKRIVETLKLNGNIGLQFREDNEGIPKIIESNPRVQGTIVLCTAAGANLVYLAVKLALGEAFSAPKPKWGTRMIRYWDEVYCDENGRTFTL